ncbi:hypothetical protein EV204_1171, partial [Tissierella praeacuta]|uniref:hypothetical protein n=1 Tax=Tissierella praeacuta TaxID=43131 RepID=UPI0010D32F57
CCKSTFSSHKNTPPCGKQFFYLNCLLQGEHITFTDIIISLVGGILTSSIFYFTIKSVYKTPKNGNSFAYKKNSFVNLTLNEDKLIDTFVKHRIIPKPTDNSNSSSGRSTTHTSSSGNTHGGGGRKF